MPQQAILILFVDIRIESIRDKLRDIETRVWLSETYLYTHSYQLVQLQEPEDDDVPTIVNELETMLKDVRIKASNSIKAYNSVYKVAKEGNFTKTLQEDASKEVEKFQNALNDLHDKCDWYKEEIVKRLSGKESGI